MNNRHAQYTERVIRHSNIRKPYQGVPDTANTVVSKQLKLIDCLITQLENHGLYSNTMVGGWSNYTYRISLKKTKYPSLSANNSRTYSQKLPLFTMLRKLHT